MDWLIAKCSENMDSAASIEVKDGDLAMTGRLSQSPFRWSENDVSWRVAVDAALVSWASKKRSTWHYQCE